MASTPRVEDRSGLEEEMRSEKTNRKMIEMERDGDSMIDYGNGNVTEEVVVVEEEGNRFTLIRSGQHFLIFKAGKWKIDNGSSPFAARVRLSY